MARPKKTEASVAIEKRLREMEKDKPKVYNIMDDGKFGQKSPDSVLLNVRLAAWSSSRISLGTTTDIRRGKRVRVAEAN